MRQMSKTKSRLSGLYGITDSTLLPSTTDLLNSVEAALDGGMSILQYREKKLSEPKQIKQAQALKRLCNAYHALFIINDNVSLAHKVNADGVHLGKTDSDIEQARRKLGSDRLIGASCYNRIDLALDAQNRGFDYVAFGRFFPSLTKPEAVAADPQLLQQVRDQLTIPVCAIGGINLENANIVIEQGADMIAVIHDLFSAQDVRQQAGNFAALFL
jgi:thiamine-phosphate pyrophosphorylase